MHIEPDAHDRFVAHFGLNMLNTLTSSKHHEQVRERRFFAFDERGGVLGGVEGRICDFQHLTTGVFHARQRRVVGVRYRCEPHGLNVPIVGAFHTHPALFDRDTRKVRRRIERLLWLSVPDRRAFLQQHRLYGYEWHFVGCVDIACFHIGDVQAGRLEPRHVLPYRDLEGLITRLAPVVARCEALLHASVVQPVRAPSAWLGKIVAALTEAEGHRSHVSDHRQHLDLDVLAMQVGTECHLLGLRTGQVRTMLSSYIKQHAEQADSARFTELIWRHFLALRGQTVR
jgi:hypothetical protein